MVARTTLADPATGNALAAGEQFSAPLAVATSLWARGDAFYVDCDNEIAALDLALEDLSRRYSDGVITKGEWETAADGFRRRLAAEHERRGRYEAEKRDRLASRVRQLEAQRASAQRELDDHDLKQITREEEGTKQR